MERPSKDDVEKFINTAAAEAGVDTQDPAFRRVYDWLSEEFGIEHPIVD